MKFFTKAIHVGQKFDNETGAVIPPIYMTSTYAQEKPDTHKGYDYTRAGNPNFKNLETTLASLEQGKIATVFSSGIGSITALVSSIPKGSKVLIANDLYGGTYRLFSQIFSRFGIGFSTVDTQDLGQVENFLKERPALLFLETPSNPLLRITDIKSIATIAKKYNVLTVVDNTFATPYFQNPLTLGADFVMHSTTKYIAGHSDVLGGVVITNQEAWKEKLDFARMAMGLNPSPFDTWLISRGIKTLGVRMKQHATNADHIANYFKASSKVKKVYYPGLLHHTNHDIAKKQMTGYSGIVSVEFDLSLELSMELASSFKLFLLAESLGGVESLVGHPASMTHASIPKKERSKNGLSDGLIRFSCGIEDKDDLVEDVDNALKKY